MPTRSRRSSNRTHLSIGEVLSLLQDDYPDVTISKIRFLESQGLLDPERTPSGYRKFYEADIDRLRWILTQQKENFLPLKVIKDRLLAGELDGDDGSDGAEGSPPPSAQTPPPPPPPPPPPTASQTPTTSTNGAPVTTPRGAEHNDPSHATGHSSAAARAGISSAGTPLDGSSTSVSMSAEELAGACGLELRHLSQLEEYGLLQPGRIGDAVYYDDEALLTARLCASLWEAGIEPRHLRMYLVSAQREAGAYEQLLLPLLQQRRPAARQEALERLAAVVDVGEQLHAVLLGRLLRDAFRTG